MLRAGIATFGLCSLMWTGCGDDAAAPADAGFDAGGGGSAGSDSAARSDRDAGTREERDASPAVDAATALASLTVRFQALVGQRPFACGQQYESIGSTQLAATPIDFRFFVQDIKLITRDGAEVDFEIPARPPFQGEGVALIDFIDGNGECATGDPAVNTEIVGRAPAGDYTGIVFSNGVPESLNHQNIALAAPPLQNAGLYWGWLNGYRFLLAEIDPLASEAEDAGVEDAGVAATSSLIHIGSGVCAGSSKNGFSCNRPNRNRVRLTGFDPTERAIVADFAAIFAHTDLRLAKQCHGAESGCDGVFEALGVAIDSGAALETQGVFRRP